MADFLNTIIPNVMTKPDELWESFGQTVYMVIVSGAISMVSVSYTHLTLPTRRVV